MRPSFSATNAGGTFTICLIHLAKMVILSKFYVNVKIKQSRCSSEVAQRFPGSYGSQISWQRHRMVVRLSALGTGRPYSQEIHLVLISVRDRVDNWAIVRPEGMCHWNQIFIYLLINITHFVMNHVLNWRTQSYATLCIYRRKISVALWMQYIMKVWWRKSTQNRL
jgi:hypothetical protein